MLETGTDSEYGNKDGDLSGCDKYEQARLIDIAM